MMTAAALHQSCRVYGSAADALPGPWDGVNGRLLVNVVVHPPLTRVSGVSLNNTAVPLPACCCRLLWHLLPRHPAVCELDKGLCACLLLFGVLPRAAKSHSI